MSDLCEKVKYLVTHLDEKYTHTLREFLLLKHHANTCESCGRLIDEVNNKHLHIGPPREPN